jgi:hypothetical protein
MNDLLANIIRWTGTITALLALCATVPGATWGLIYGARHRVLKLLERSRRSRVPLSPETIGLNAEVLAAGIVTQRSDATLDERVRFLSIESMT